MFSPASLSLLAAVLFGISIPASKALLGEIEPVELAGLMYLGAAIGVAPFAIRGQPVTSLRSLTRVNKLRLTGAILFGGILAPIALLKGLQSASALSTSLWLNLELISTALLGHFFFRDRLGGPGWAGSAGVLGASLILTGGGTSAGGVAVLSIGATRSFMIFSSAPFFGAGISAVALGERLYPYHLLAALIFGSSLMLILWDRHDHAHWHTAIEHLHLHRHDDGHHLHGHPGISSSRPHSHGHRHEHLGHAHPHRHDLHHRHPDGTCNSPESRLS